MNGSEHLDKKILDSIRNLMPARFDDLVEKYLENTTAHINQAIKAAAARNAHDVASAMHAIKSSSASLGLVRVAQVAKDIEAATDAIDNGGIEDWVSVAGSLVVLDELLRTAKIALEHESKGWL